MENFVVSARKYRPATFDSVVGQSHVTNTLINEIKNNQLAQAFLFNGPRGVGKTTCARILAKEINKESISDDNYDFSYNVFELDAASNNSVEDIRHLNEQVRIPPQVGKYKVYIIDEVHMLSAAAFNAFLKTLEEPPPYAIFILATTERHKILPTILSRCQVFTFNRISVKDIVLHLKDIGQKEGVEMEEEALHIIAQKADGALRDALSIFDQMVSISADKTLKYSDVVKNLNVLDYDYYFKITDAFNAQNVGEVLLVFDEILANGFDGQIFLNGLANHFRDLMVGRSPETVKLLDVPPHVHQKYLDTSKQMSQGLLVNAINIANQFDLGYKASRNQRLHVELALIKMCYLNNLVQPGEKKNTSVNQAVATPTQVKPPTPNNPVETNQVKHAVSPEKGAEIKSEKKERSRPVPTSKASEKVAKLGDLDDLLTSDVTLPEKEEKPATVAEEEPVEYAKEIDHESVIKVIGDFANKLKEENRFQHSLFKLVKPTVADNVVKMEMIKQHRIQLEEIKVEFLQFLRAGLSNSKVQLEVIEVKKKAEGTRAYTGQEKFEVMAKKNPALKSLKEKLNLSLR
ncbi:MAG: DNA polymerase III subunit gamma/tau [Bacteroidia bacterium]|nr:DNA polymerase III subunit gamma/tau [Bacteroidia bacterium]